MKPGDGVSGEPSERGRTGDDGLAALLLERARQTPDLLALADVTSPEGDVRPVRWADLARHAFGIAETLRGVGQPGDRVLVGLGNGSRFVASLFACFIAGRIAVPVPMPRRGRSTSRLGTIIADCSPVLGLVDTDRLGLAREVHPDLEWLAVEDRAIDALPEVAPEPGSQIAYLQYTSGSTGDPRGVRISHANLIANAQDIAQRVPCDDRSVMLCWLPLYHDMGLVYGTFYPLLAGFPTYLLEPTAFLQQPLSWPRLIAQLGATHSGGPTFSYGLAAERGQDADLTGLDLSTWRVAMCGAEPIHRPTLERFAQVFAPAGFRAEAFGVGYGLAEATLMVTAGAGGLASLDTPEADSPPIVSVGAPAPGTRVRIVDPETLQPCPWDVIGEVWVSGPAVADGFWGRPEESARVFGNRLPDEDGTFLRTGDLGFERDGELGVTGRLKELIIVRGGNYHPHDLERVSETADAALRPHGAVAFGLPGEGSDKLVILQEVQRTSLRKLDAPAAMQAIRAAIAHEAGITPDRILLLRPGAIPQTSSGKPQRRLLRAQYLNGEIKPVAEWQAPKQPDQPSPENAGAADRAALEEWLARRIAARIGLPVEDIDTTAPFDRYGLDSLAATALARDLGEHLGRQVSPTLVYDYPSAAELARHLAGPTTRHAPAATVKAQEPIAILGMAARLPRADDLAQVEHLLFSGIDAVRELPAGRWAQEAERLAAALEEPARSVPITRGGWLDNVDGFDERFFGISAREASFIDPQQRLLMEVAWHALEDARIPPNHLAGRDVGICIGISDCDYRRRAGGASAIDPYLGTGSALSIAANRLSYFFDLRGPSLAIDTACSSSLVAVHEAAEMLRQRRVPLALAGGVNLILGPETSLIFAQNGMLSADGLCKTFDARADGYVRGEGCGIVVLKRLDEALRDGDPIRAVLRGSAVNQDGRSNGITAPNGPAQQEVMRRALAAAACAPGDIGFVEAHGTGTALGDPIELAALDAVYGRSGDTPCPVGAFKSQIGHLEAAAGIAGLVKAAIVVERGTIPANQHFQKPNERLPLDGSRLVPAARPASLTQTAPLAAVSSFGFGGTNAHVIVGPVPERTASRDAESVAPTPPGLLVFSARDRDALRALAQAHTDRVAELGTEDFAAYCRSAALGRSHLPCRAAVVATDGMQAARRLRGWLDGAEDSAVFAGDLAPGAGRARVAFLFTGQGALAAGNGSELLSQQPVFRDAMARADRAARSADIDLLSALRSDEALRHASIVQPMQFAFAHALAELWKSWGITPDAVLGHSLGEYAAACLAGSFDMSEAVHALIARGRLAEQFGPKGAMLAVKANARDIAAVLSEVEVYVAVDNGPQAISLAGAPDAIAEAQERIEAKGLKCTRLDITHAFHHPAMAPVADGLAQHLREVTLREPALPFFSSVTGQRETDAITQPGYWAEQITRPVHFADGLRALSAFGCDLYLEIGPAPVLTRLGGTVLPDRPAQAFIESLRPGQPEPQVLAEALARLYVAGARPDWGAVFRGAGSSTVPLPLYPFQRRRHWLPEQRGARPSASAVPQPLETASRSEAIFAASLDPRTSAYLADHRVNGHVITPGATMISLAAQVGWSVLGRDRSVSLAQVRFVAPLELVENDAQEVQLLTVRDLPGPLELMARQADGEWTCHFTAELGAASETTGAPELATLRAACAEAVDPDAIYAALGRARLDYGPALRKFGEIWLGDHQCLARLETMAASGAGAGPAEIDACFQALGALLPEASTPLVPAFADRIVMGPAVAGGALWCHVAARSEPGADPRFDLRLLVEGAAEPLLSVDGLTLRPLRATPRATAGTTEGLLHQMRWLPEPLRARPEADLESIGTSLFESMDDPANRTLRAEWSALDSALERVSQNLASHVLSELTGRTDHAGMDVEAIGREAGIAPGFERLLARLREMAHEAGPISGAVAAKDPFADLSPAIAESPEMRLLRHLADHIPQVLRGTADPLALLFGEQDGGLAAAVYRGSAGLELMNRLAADGVKTLAEARTGDEPLSVLEIGGGTGATTRHVLDALSGRRVDYLFTDVSAAFLAHASDRFAAQDGFGTAVLDIERDPSAQSLAPAAHDCVIAANVLHATQDLSQTLRHVRSLVAPGGVVMLVEGTQKSGFSDITFGLTSGWWRFTDHDLRPDHPLLSEDAWRSVLERSGFDAVEVVSPRGPDGTPLGQSLILARAAQPARRANWLILADRGGTGRALADALGDQGEVAVLPETPEQALGEGLEKADIVVDLRALDAPAASDIRDGSAALSVAATLGTEAAQLIAAMADRSAPPPRLVLVTRGAEAAGDHAGVPGLAQSVLRGLGRVAALEHPQLHPLRIDLDPMGRPTNVAQLVDEVLREGAEEEEIAFRQGLRMVGRIAALPAPSTLAGTEGKPAPGHRRVLAAEQPGDLSSIRFIDRPEAALPADAIEVAADATALHFRDLLTALDRYGGQSDAALLGTECAGTVTRVGGAVTDFAVGDRVVALADGACSSHVVVPQARAVPLPEGLDPIRAMDCGAYLTAARAFAAAGRVPEQGTILVHAGAGATGLAALHMARRRGLRTMATASPWKWPALRQLGVEAVFHSRNTDFGQGVRAATGGRGVDLIFNSLAGEAIPTGLDCLAEDGIFVELGITGIWSDADVAQRRPDVRYRPINLVEDLKRDPTEIRAMMRNVVEDLAEGRLPGLPKTLFPLDRFGEAFRALQSASRIGRIVIDHRRRAEDGPPIRRSGTYLVTGGLGGLGLVVAEWLVERGARSLVLAGRRAPDAAAERVIAACREAGARVRVAQLDVADRTALSALLNEVGQGPDPLCGLFHAAGVLDDATLLNLDPERMERVLRPKVVGAMDLHQLTRDCALDYFVLFSSAAALFGAPGQAAHSAANAFLDALAVHRQSCGLPAHSIQWGAWGEIGAAARKGAEGPSHLPGLGQMAPAEGLAALDALLVRPGAVSAALEVDWQALDQAYGPRPLLRQLVRPTKDTGPAPQSGPMPTPEIAALRALAPAEARDIMTEFVADSVRRILAVPEGLELRPDQGFFDMGMDSLTSLELRNVLQRAFGRPMPSVLTFDYPNVEALAAWLTTELVGVAEAPADAPKGLEAETAASSDDIESLQRELAREIETFRGASA